MKKGLIIFLFILGIALGYFFTSVYPKLEIISGYNAKNLCSCMFVTGLDQETAERVDLGFGPLWMASNTVDTKNKTVFSNVLGMHPKKAVYREGMGCTIEGEKTLVEWPGEKIQYKAEIWPDEVVPNPELQSVLAEAFDQGGESLLNTRAVIVVKDGKLIGEAYGPGITKATPLLGWSMAKSVTSCLTGILAKDGFWSPEDPMQIADWQVDERSKITLGNLLQMSSGLEWEEDYSKVSTATTMLYGTDGMGTYAASQPLAHEPNTHWLYSSGTSNIISKQLSTAFETHQEYIRFPYERLFGPIGAESFLIETDGDGYFVGSSYAYATGRDWAKLGLLYLNRGNWLGEQIIDSNWVAYSHSPAEASSNKYGAQFWLNAANKFQDYGSDAYWMDGFQGQQVAIHPEQNMVIVRLGVMYDEGNFDFSAWTAKVFQASL